MTTIQCYTAKRSDRSNVSSTIHCLRFTRGLGPFGQELTHPDRGQARELPCELTQSRRWVCDIDAQLVSGSSPRGSHGISRLEQPRQSASLGLRTFALTRMAWVGQELGVTALA